MNKQRSLFTTQQYLILGALAVLACGTLMILGTLVLVRLRQPNLASEPIIAVSSLPPAASLPSYSVVGTWKWDRQRGNAYDGVYYIRFRNDGMVTYCRENENPNACDWTASRYTILSDSEIRIHDIGNGRMWEFSDSSSNDVIKYRVTEDALTLFRLGWEEIYLVRVDR